MRTFVTVWAIVFGFDCMVCGAQTTEPPVPDLPSATVSISWSDVKDLIERARAQEGKAPEHEAPPVPWTLASALYEAEALADNSLKVTAHFDATVWEPRKWVQIPLIGGDVAVASATLDNEPVSLTRTEDQKLSVLVDTPGQHTFELVFYAKAISQDGEVFFSFPTVPTAITRMTLTVPVERAEVTSASATSITAERRGEGVTAQLAFPPVEEIQAGWSLPADLQAKTPDEELRMTGTDSTLAVVGDRLVSCQSLVQYDVLRGGSDTFRLQLPASANILAVEGQGAAWTQREEEGRQHVEVKVNHRVTDHYEVKVVYEAEHDEQAATVAVPELVIEDVTRASGFIGVTARGPVELTPAEDIAGLTRTDTSELPAAVRMLSSSPILFAYRYTDESYLLAMNVRRLEDVPVRVASIDAVQLTTVVTDKGMAVTRAEYLVRNNIKQFLRIRLNEGAELWGAEVAGKVVKPAREPGTDVILVPLLKSIESDQLLNAFAVSITYMERLDALTGLWRDVALASPAADILANEVRWTVMLPGDRTVVRTSGDIESDPFVETGQPKGQLAETIGKYSGLRQTTIYPLREGVERFLITDVNNPGAQTSGRRRYQSDPLPPQPFQAGDTAVAGVLPIEMAFPTEGVAYAFKGLLIPQDEPVSVTLTTVSSRLKALLIIAMLLLGLVAGLRLGKRLACVVTPRNSATIGGAVLSVGLLLSMVGLYSIPWLAASAFGLSLGIAVALARPFLMHIMNPPPTTTAS